MTDSDKDNETGGDLIISGLEYTFAVLAAILGLSIPFAGASLGVAGTAAAVARDVAERRKAQRQARFSRLVNELRLRVEALEGKTQSDAETDLFLEVVEKAIKDDEDAKTPIYAAILDWILRDKPKAVQVRILSDAIKDLSYLEIYSFLVEVNGKQARKVHESFVSENVLWNRLARAGLHQGGTVRHMGSPTEFGRILANYCLLDTMAAPV